jgi:glyceraldehyde-3-phosphate dehydrogenase (NADP+)
MKENAGKKKVVLELGGNAGVIVTSTANVNDAVKKCLVSGFSYSGQVCIHAQRIIVQKTIFEKFSSLFLEGVSKLKTGNPEDVGTELSVMIDEENARRIESWVKESVANGAKVLRGGERDKTFYPATVLTCTNKKMKVNCEEVFGPVVILESFVNFDDAIQMINDTKFGLQAGVFTNEISEMDKAFNEINVGGVILNDVPSLRLDHMPYGGIKESGLGREGVKYAIQDMMEAKILVK